MNVCLELLVKKLLFLIPNLFPLQEILSCAGVNSQPQNYPSTSFTLSALSLGLQKWMKCHRSLETFAHHSRGLYASRKQLMQAMGCLRAKFNALFFSPSPSSCLKIFKWLLVRINTRLLAFTNELPATL